LLAQRLVEFTLASGIPEALHYWADKLEKSASELCNDSDCKRIQFKIDMDRNVQMYASDYDALECLIRSLKKHEEGMGEITQKIIHHAIHVCIVKSARQFEI